MRLIYELVSHKTIDFITNPNYEKIKDKIDVIVEEYMKEYREVIIKKASKINYVFL